MELNKQWNKGISTYRRKLFGAIWLMAQCRYGAFVLFFSGLLFLLFRLAGVGENFLYLLTGGTLLFLSLPASLFCAWKALPSAGKLTIFAASRLPGGGKVLSALETGRSEEIFPPLPVLPGVRFLKWRRDTFLLLTGACFCAGTLTVPVENSTLVKNIQKLDLKDEEEKLSKALEVMKKITPESDKRASQLQKELDEAVKNADPASPGRTYELLNELDRRIRQELTCEGARQSDLLRQVEMLQQAAAGLSRAGAKGNSYNEFSQLLKTIAQKNPALAASLKKGGFKDLPMSQKELEKLASSLKTDAESLKRSLENMSSVCENQTALSGSAPAAAGKELEEFLRENVPGCDDLIESLTNRDHNGEPGESMGGAGGDGQSGTGAPTRGRGDAPLEFSGVSPDYGARMVDRKAVPAGGAGKENSSLVGRFASDAEEKVEKYTAKGGTLGTSGGVSARQESTVYPAHRRAVRRYFERKKP